MPPLDQSIEFLSADAEHLVALGNRHRDARAWMEAAEAYHRYLRLRREDWAIWVQYGHCLKESGDVRGALRCYEEAERLQSDDSDLHLQKGHALKLLGRQEDAVNAYAKALALDPGNADARRELMGDGPAPVPAAAPAPEPGPAAPPAVAAGTVLVFDASDLLDYLRHNRAPTGIQRVQLNIIREALRADPAQPVLVTAFDPEEGGWRPLPGELFLRLAALSRSGTEVADPAWQEAVGAAQAALREVPALEFPPGSALVNLGTSWWLPEYLRRVREAKARFGLRYVPFLHDGIPLLVPEHCAEALVDEFARWFAGLCLHADAVLANSDCTRDDFRRLRATVAPGQDIPCHVVPLDAAPERGEAGPLPPGLRDGRPFVLCVGTIESRKNHLMVFQAWLTLARRHGIEAVPDLVCVGKRGWMAEEALRLHARSPILQAKVHLLHGVPDTVLEALYRDCLFTLNNSFYEGWGLPVTEGLAHGKLALVPENSAYPQSAGAGGVFFAPGSLPELAAHVWQLATDAAHRRGLEQRLARTVRLRSWAEVAAQVMREAAGVAALPAPLARLALPLARTHAVRLLPGPDARAEMAVADALREGPGWSPLEAWGAWARPGESRIRLPLPAEAEDVALRVYLDLQAPAEAGAVSFRAGRGSGPVPIPQRVELQPGERLFAMVTVPAGPGRELLVEIEPVYGAGRMVETVGVRGIMACRTDDHAARLEFLESRALSRPAA